MDRWPHQIRGVRDVIAAIASGERRILLTSPTGMGKSIMMLDLIEHYLGLGWYSVLYSNRKMLHAQLCKTLAAHGLDYGVRAAGWSDDGRFEPVQISSLPTERSRVLRKGTWRIHGEGKQCLAVVDEAHLNKGTTSQEIYRRHLEAGHVILGVTATPLDLAELYDVLIVAGTVSEGRECGALVPCYHYGPDEPNLKGIGRVALGDDPTEKEQRSAMGEAGTEKAIRLFGRIVDWRERLNPDGRPCLLFGPGVAESLWIAEQFKSHGVKAAHIDGADVWIDGNWYRSDDYEARDAVRDGSKSGDIKVVCNRFVLREGIDWPWIEHVILACVCGSLQTYLQIVGRGLRASPSTGKRGVILQDHGGHWHRMGSVNVDREWSLELTSHVVAGVRQDAMRSKEKPEPARCPRCAKIIYGYRCVCGWQTEQGSKRSRPVIQTDGTLRYLTGDIYRPRQMCSGPGAAKLWERMYHRGRSKRWNATFKQAFAVFASENGWRWPDLSLPLMPVDPLDVYRKIADVPRDRLTACMPMEKSLVG
jgi:superfamily II DNA or RNA helicase